MLIFATNFFFASSFYYFISLCIDLFIMKFQLLNPKGYEVALE